MTKPARPRASRTRPHPAPRPLLDPLEPRTLFAATTGPFPYVLTELGNASTNATTAVSINASGDVVGTLSTLQNVHPFVLDYQTGVVTDFSTPLGDAHNAFAKSINNLGLIVGNFTDANGMTEAFLYRPSQNAFTNLSDHGVTTANAINNNNEVAGADGAPDLPASAESGPNHHAYFMDLNTLTPVRQVDLDPTLGSAAYALSFGGRPAGVSYVANPTPGAAPIPEGTLFVPNTNAGNAPTDLGHGIVYATDTVGAVAGTHLSADLSTRSAAISLGAVWHDLGTLGGPNSEARGMTDNGVVVGFSDVTTDTNTHAFLYDPQNRQTPMVDLNSLIDPADRVTLLTANAINDKGQIVGDLVNNATGAHHGYVLTPANFALPNNGNGITFTTANAGGGGGGGGGNSSVTGTVSAKLPAAPVVIGAKISFSVSFTVTAGPVTVSGTVTSQLFLSRSTTVDDDAVPLTTPVRKNVKLKPHAHTPLKFIVKSIPAAVNADGDYHVVAKLTDPKGTATTVAATGTLHIALPRIDLAGSFSKPPKPAKNGKTNLSFTVNNAAGNTPAKGPLVYNVLTSPTGHLDDATLLKSFTKNLNLTNGKSAKLSTTLTLPPGTYFVLIQLDPNDTFHDPTPHNDLFATNTQITV